MLMAHLPALKAGVPRAERVWAVGFRVSFLRLTIETGSGNAGATGLDGERLLRALDVLGCLTVGENNKWRRIRTRVLSSMAVVAAERQLCVRCKAVAGIVYFDVAKSVRDLCWLENSSLFLFGGIHSVFASLHIISIYEGVKPW